jgi:hypothetical protein
MRKRGLFLWTLAAFLALRNDAFSQLLIVSDTNRDGRVSFADDSEGRDTWTERRGALFMFNNDSDQRNGKQDCSDKIVNGPADLLDLAPVFIQRIPQLNSERRLLISISEAARPFVNIFYKSGSEHVFVANKERQELPPPAIAGR